VHVSIAWLKDCPKAYWVLRKIWLSEEFIAMSIKPERADALVDQGTHMALMGTYVCLNGW
jgi:hypothetical protein